MAVLLVRRSQCSRCVIVVSCPHESTVGAFPYSVLDGVLIRSNVGRRGRRRKSARALWWQTTAFLTVAVATVVRGSAAAQDFDLPSAPGGADARPPASAEPTKPPTLTRAPTLIRDVTPTYPPAALAQGLGADVTLLLDIGAEGHVTHVEVKTPVGNGFDEAATEAAGAMEFSAAEIDGKPAPIRIEYVLHFRPPAPPIAAPAGVDRVASAPAVAAAPPPLRLVLRGKVREKGSRTAIAGASILLQPLSTTGDATSAASASNSREIATSDGEGNFDVRLPEPSLASDAPSNGLRLVVSDSTHDGCVRELRVQELRHAMATPIEWTCYSRPNLNALGSTVRAARTRPEISRRSVEQSEMVSVPGTFGDPLRVIQNLPGMARSPYGLGLVIVRGAPPTDTGIFVNGQGVPRLYHFLVGPSVIAPHLVERVDFFPGGFGVRYGRVSGGAIDIALKEDPSPALHGGVDVGVLDVSAFVEGPVAKDTSATASIRRSTIDAILPRLIPQRQGSTFATTVPVYWDYQARVIRELPTGRLGLMAFGSDDSLKIVRQDPESGDFSLNSHASFHRVMAFWTTRWRGWTSRLSPSYGNGEEQFSLGTGGGYIRYQRFFLRWDASHALGDKWEARIGFDGLVSYDTAFFDTWFPREGRAFGPAALERGLARRELYDWAPAIYAEAEWKPTPRLRITPGLRFDQFHVIDKDRFSWDPRLIARWQLTDSWLLKSGAGIYHQLPVPQFLDVEFGNPNLGLIWSDQYHVGVEHPLTPLLHLDVSAYFLRRRNLPLPSTERFSSTGLGRAWGLEVWLKHDITARLFGWIAYTLSWSEQTGATAQEMISGTADATPTRTGPGTYRPSPYDQRHNLTVVASYRWRAWQFGGRYRLVSGRPAAHTTGAFFDADFGGYTPVAQPAGERLPLFSQADLRAERTFTFDVWTLGAYLDVQNIFNAENAENFAYDYRYGQRAPVRGLPIFPIVGLRGRF